MTSYESVLESIGGTPLIRLTRAVAGLRPRIYIKPEWQNPGGSVKDRAAVSMIRRAEADGSLRPGGTVVEVTSGNTGIGLVMAAAHLGYRAVIFTSSTIAAEKRAQITAYGAELRLVDTFVPKSHPSSMRSVAERFVAETPGAWFAQQYDNPANPGAHYVGTGPEIWKDSLEAVTHLVTTVGTGGTISGTGRYLKEVSGGRVRVIGADPITSVYAGGDGSQKFIEGAGHFVHPEATVDDWPQALDLSVVDAFVGIDDQEAIWAAHRVAREEGILVGGSSGVALAAAFREAASLTEADTVVVVLPDSGRLYLSTYYSDTWLTTNGFTPHPPTPTTATSTPAVPAVPAAPGPAPGPAPSPAPGPAPSAPTTRAVGEFAVPAPLIQRGEGVDDVVRRLVGEGVGEDAVVLVAYPREKRTLAPHHSDLLGWTTLANLRTAAEVADVIQPAGPRLGAGLSVTDPAVAADPAVTAWTTGPALVLTAGRVTGVVTRDALGG